MLYPSELLCTLWATLYPTKLRSIRLTKGEPSGATRHPILCYWATLHPTELCCTLRATLYPSYLLRTLWATMYPTELGCIYCAELRCTLLNYAATFELRCTLLNYAATFELRCTQTELLHPYNFLGCRTDQYLVSPVPEWKEKPMLE